VLLGTPISLLFNERKDIVMPHGNTIFIIAKKSHYKQGEGPFEDFFAIRGCATTNSIRV
jgi:hypothetical protein